MIEKTRIVGVGQDPAGFFLKEAQTKHIVKISDNVCVEASTALTKAHWARLNTDEIQVKSVTIEMVGGGSLTIR